MLGKKCSNDELEYELTSYVDNKQNVWFKGKDIAQILGYSKPRNALKRQVSEENKMSQLYWDPERIPNKLGALIGAPTEVQNKS